MGEMWARFLLVLFGWGVILNLCLFSKKNYSVYIMIIYKKFIILREINSYYEIS